MSDKIWAICKGTKIHRLTFSKSLAELIANDEYQIHRLSYREGKELSPGEKSSSGLYGIKSTTKDIILRISLFQEAAEMMRDKSRSICEIFIS